MKKFLCAIAALSLFSTAGLKADEGMWMLPLLEKMNIKVMQQEGCRLTAEQGPPGDQPPLRIRQHPAAQLCGA